MSALCPLALVDVLCLALGEVLDAASPWTARQAMLCSVMHCMAWHYMSIGQASAVDRRIRLGMLMLMLVYE